MKIRNGFVSNSSSSSFIVCFPNGKPKDVHELQRLLFADEVGLANPYRWGDDPGVFPASTVAMRVWDDLKDQKPVTEFELNEYYSSNVDFHADPPPEQDYDWPSLDIDRSDPEKFEKHPEVIEYRKKHDAWMERYADWKKTVIENFVKVAGPGELFEFEYEDHNGPMETSMEHGDLFRRLPHIKVSNH